MIFPISLQKMTKIIIKSIILSLITYIIRRMKKYREIYQQAKNLSDMESSAIDLLLWNLLCYPPKMPLRIVHQQLLQKAEPFTLTVSDDYFSKKEILFNGFKWGTGEIKILITHGWSSKAADLSILIEMIIALPNVQVIAFDSPGNGSSEAELSNLFRGQ